MSFTTLNANGELISEEANDPLTTVGEGVGSGGVAEEMLSLSYPNPTHGTATIEFVLSGRSSNIELIVTDQSGKEVMRLIDGERLLSGVHVVHFDGSALPSGTYFYTISTANGKETKSLKVVR